MSLENEGTQELNEQTQETAGQAEAPQVEEQSTEVQAAEATSTTEATGQGGETTETPTWTPDYKYKVRDEEHEFEDWAKPLITNEDTRKKFQDLYTRGHGLELAKRERDEFKGKYSQLEESLTQVGELVRKGDARSFIEALGLPKDMFIKYAIEELQYQELPPEERRKIDMQRQEATRLSQLEFQNQQLQQQYMSAEANRVARETDFYLQSPDVSQYANGYDALVGTPGAFRSLVLEIGDYHYRNGNTGYTVQQAVQSAVERVRTSGALAGASNPTQQVAGTQTQVRTAQQQAQKPVIPNVQSQGTSPVKKVYNSIDELRAKHRELTGQ